MFPVPRTKESERSCFSIRLLVSIVNTQQVINLKGVVVYSIQNTLYLESLTISHDGTRVSFLNCSFIALSDLTFIDGGLLECFESSLSRALVRVLSDFWMVELRDYVRRNFGWSSQKADDTLLPVIKRVNDSRKQLVLR